MVEHLEVGIHVAGVSLVNEAVVVGGTIGVLAKVEDNEDVGADIDCFDFCNFVELGSDYFHSLFNDFRGHLIRRNPTRFSPDDINFIFLFFLIGVLLVADFCFDGNCLGIL